jgi:ATP-dependent phosphofructokinase / diphosphate-dependent phosphofructokinase
MTGSPRRIAVNSGSGYVPGLNAVLAGVVLAASRLGIEVVGIRDGYDGLLEPDAYPDGGVVPLRGDVAEALSGAAGSILGSAPRHDPFRLRTVNAEGMVEEVDRSDDLLERLRAANIDAAISIGGGSSLTGSHALAVAFKLSRKGLPTVCIPKSVENDIAATALAFGYNSALSYTTDTLDRIRTGARDARRVAVAEVLGSLSGWLALQSGIATCADAVLIPEIPHDLKAVAARMPSTHRGAHLPSLVVVAEGATPRDGSGARASDTDEIDSVRKSLSPLSDLRYGQGSRVIDRSGHAAATVAMELQQLTGYNTLPINVGQLVRGATPTALDRQLGLGYGSAAVLALHEGTTGVMMAFDPPELTTVPLAQALNQIRTVPRDSAYIDIARFLGICLGE